MLKALSFVAITTGVIVYLLFSAVMDYANDLKDYQEKELSRYCQSKSKPKEECHVEVCSSYDFVNLGFFLSNLPCR